MTSYSRFLPASRGRIVELLRHEMMTADELATTLRQTRHAVRAQLRSMERNGVIEPAGLRPATTRPFVVYRLAPQVEQLLSRAYTPFLTRLVEVFAARHAPEDVELVMRETGRGLAQEWCGRVAGRSFPERLAEANRVLTEELGAITHVEEQDDEVTIRGAACPLSAVTGKHPGACLAIESLLAECLGVPVTECCDRQQRPRCCFRIHGREPIKGVYT